MGGSSEVTPAARPRGAGRPSTVAPYEPQVAQWLREDPDLPGVEILRRVRRAGIALARARSTSSCGG